MALSQHDLLRLLESLRSTDGLELVRSVAERTLQELIEAEATARIGAEWNEHTDSRTALRNGHRDKTLSTQAGDLELGIPKLRSGNFYPVLLQRHSTGTSSTRPLGQLGRSSWTRSQFVFPWGILA